MSVNNEFEVIFSEKEFKGSLSELLVKCSIICLNIQPPKGVLKSSRKDEQLNESTYLHRCYLGPKEAWGNPKEGP